eukprot:GHRR01025353.1.p2 GENE.GHRR01025353.1~~GHRR01025353.1.p2  ORF type:complete len:110 (-),score=21.32 GHRR01025353.1:220-549(-)
MCMIIMLCMPTLEAGTTRHGPHAAKADACHQHPACTVTPGTCTVAQNADMKASMYVTGYHYCTAFATEKCWVLCHCLDTQAAAAPSCSNAHSQPALLPILHNLGVEVRH